MGSSNRQSIAGQVWGLVRAQHGVVARWQLLELGMSAPAIRHRLSTARLHRIERGVYAVGRPTVTRRGRWMAAVLGGGPGAVLSHGSAAALWSFGEEVDGRIEISVPVDSSRRRPTVEVHRRPGLRQGDMTKHDGIPVTGVPRTLVDIAARLGRARLERAVNEADRLELVNPEVLLARLEEYSGQRGVARLREILGGRTFRLTDSELERRFLRLIEAAGLPMPETGVRLNGFRVDFFWPDLGLVVETDGLRYHRTPAQQARDRLRDQAHTAAGMTPLRFTHEQVRFQADYVQETLKRVAWRFAKGTR
jgi:very-short-patch-repair endonuclease/predicted transcriptional regulator of viral defense system